MQTFFQGPIGGMLPILAVAAFFVLRGVNKRTREIAA